MDWQSRRCWFEVKRYSTIKSLFFTHQLLSSPSNINPLKQTAVLLHSSRFFFFISAAIFEWHFVCLLSTFVHSRGLQPLFTAKKQTTKFSQPQERVFDSGFAHQWWKVLTFTVVFFFSKFNKKLTCLCFLFQKFCFTQRLLILIVSLLTMEMLSCSRCRQLFFVFNRSTVSTPSLELFAFLTVNLLKFNRTFCYEGFFSSLYLLNCGGYISMQCFIALCIPSCYTINSVVVKINEKALSKCRGSGHFMHLHHVHFV